MTASVFPSHKTTKHDRTQYNNDSKDRKVEKQDTGLVSSHGRAAADQSGTFKGLEPDSDSQAKSTVELAN